MTEETKKIFVAPWEATAIKGIEWGVRIKDSGLLLCDFCEEENAKRFARLPELYDALMDVAYEHCHLCIYKNSESASKMPSPNDMTTNGGASFCFQNCPRLKHWKLLKKVRDGE